MSAGSSSSPRRRRAPAADRRQRDAERSRQRLLAAALDEFSERGYAGARVGSIAARAGVNPQLITYYFGGKRGLYDALSRRWLEQEAGIAEGEATLAELAVGYLRATLEDPRLARLFLWDGLTGGAVVEEPEDLSDLQRRQAGGEIAADLDPGMFQLALMGAILAPVALPQVARRLTGLDPADPGFEDAYADQLRRMVARLGGQERPSAP
ncbi:MAG TPA: TetR family transcriptional regulator [Nocardioidaceae bacterium]